jgi:uncharacterized lipoprotein YmbA
MGKAAGRVVRTCRLLESGAPLLLAILLCGMAGCADSQATRLYLLTPTTVGNRTGADERNLSIGIGPVDLPPLLDRPQIVTRRGPGEVERAEFNRWAEPLGDSVPRVLASDLASQLGTDRVEALPWEASGRFQYQVVVDVARFDGVMGKQVVLDARWRVVGRDGRELVVRRSVLTEATDGASYQALVTSMSRALGALSQEIASALTAVALAAHAEPTHH